MSTYQEWRASQERRRTVMNRRVRQGEYSLQELELGYANGAMSARRYLELVAMLPTSTDWVEAHRDDPDAEAAILVYAGPRDVLDGAIVEAAWEVEPGKLVVELRDCHPAVIACKPTDLLWMPNRPSLIP